MTPLPRSLRTQIATMKKELKDQLVAERLSVQQTKDKGKKQLAKGLMNQKVQFDMDKEALQGEMDDLRLKFDQLQAVKLGKEREMLELEDANGNERTSFYHGASLF
jgi:ABC-type phosphate transport system auxiliary subunit